MKCPKCGFVSYPGLPQCKKCGHSFSPPPRQDSSVLSLFSEPAVPAPRVPKSSSAAAPAPLPTIHPPVEIEESPRPPGVEDGEAPSRALAAGIAAAPAPPMPRVAPNPELIRPWREELSERVENFRRRRARLREGAEPDLNLGFDFADTAADTHVAPSPENTARLDMALEAPGGQEVDAPILDALPLETPETAASAGVEAAELSLDLGRDEPSPEPAPVEILLEPLPQPMRPAAARATPHAPLGRRFLAGLIDTLILLTAAGLFGMIVSYIGVRIVLLPLNLAVLGFIAVFFITVYFGLFTSLTSSTPGLLWMGLEVRNLEGDRPTPGEAAWRAFGYLVSIAGLMLGFIWALVDSDGLTWHDRISRTSVTVASREIR